MVVAGCKPKGTAGALNATREDEAAGNERAYDFLSYVWSDIFDLRLESAGDESERDTVILRGNYEDAKFTVLYLKDGQLTAYLAVNGDIREFTVWRRLIRGKNDLRGKEELLKDKKSKKKAGDA